MKFKNPHQNKDKLEAIKELLVEKGIITEKEIKDKEKEKKSLKVKFNDK